MYFKVWNFSLQTILLWRGKLTCPARTERTASRLLPWSKILWNWLHKKIMSMSEMFTRNPRKPVEREGQENTKVKTLVILRMLGWRGNHLD